jgi:hypothetical protein
VAGIRRRRESFTEGYVKWIDVTDPLFDTIAKKFDWVMSLECGEHIPPEATEAFIDLLDRHNTKGVILSWGREATPTSTSGPWSQGS